jgi:low temperature requirement protein LtrA
MATVTETPRRRLDARMREEERVTPLELFFDLVFVLAFTQCTTLMSHDPSWEGMAQGLLILGVLWWAWTAYAWLTSVVDPEEGSVRIVIFAAMAALLIVSICVTEAFDSLALEFALAYGAVRTAHVGLFLLASRDDPQLRHSVWGLAVSTAVGVGILVAASLFDGATQLAIWGVALALDMAGPMFFIDASGWRLVPGHFAERHGLIMIIALGESIVAIGVGAEASLTLGIAVAAVLGIALVAAMWWLYFDVVALVSGRRLASAEEGRQRNELARDSYSYLHLPMVAGIILVALALKKTLAHVDDPFETVTAFALLGGIALYLLGLVGFRYRHVHTLNRQRLALSLLMFALLPLAVEIPAPATISIVTGLLCLMIAYETRMYGEGRLRLRHALPGEPIPEAAELPDASPPS